MFLHFDRKGVHFQWGSIQPHFNYEGNFFGQRLNSLQGGDLYTKETQFYITVCKKKKKKSDLTVFLNHHNKNKQTKNTIISEYSLDKTTAFKIKTLMHFTRWKMLIVNEHCTLSVSCSRWPSVRLATTQESDEEVQAYVLCLKWKEKKQKGASFYKHFSENYHSIWDQFTPGAKNRINRQHMKAEKVRFPWELHSWLHLQLNFKIQMNITMVVHICSPSVF